MTDDVEAAGNAVTGVTEWCLGERFRTAATRRRCVTGDFTRRVSCRPSLAIVLATVSESLVGASVSPVVAAILLDPVGAAGRLAAPPSRDSVTAPAVAVNTAAATRPSTSRFRPLSGFDSREDRPRTSRWRGGGTLRRRAGRSSAEPRGALGRAVV